MTELIDLLLKACIPIDLHTGKLHQLAECTRHNRLLLIFPTLSRLRAIIACSILCRFTIDSVLLMHLSLTLCCRC